MKAPSGIRATGGRPNRGAGNINELHVEQSAVGTDDSENQRSQPFVRFLLFPGWCSPHRRKVITSPIPKIWGMAPRVVRRSFAYRPKERGYQEILSCVPFGNSGAPTWCFVRRSGMDRESGTDRKSWVHATNSPVVARRKGGRPGVRKPCMGLSQAFEVRKFCIAVDGCAFHIRKRCIAVVGPRAFDDVRKCCFAVSACAFDTWADSLRTGGVKVNDGAVSGQPGLVHAAGRLARNARGLEINNGAVSDEQGRVHADRRLVPNDWSPVVRRPNAIVVSLPLAVVPKNRRLTDSHRFFGGLSADWATKPSRHAQRHENFSFHTATYSNDRAAPAPAHILHVHSLDVTQFNQFRRRSEKPISNNWP